MRTRGTDETTRVIFGALALCLSLGAGCGDDTSGVSSTEPTTVCVDFDGDGYGDNCEAGPDCNDQDIAAFAVAWGFTDTDGDGYAVGGSAEVCSGTSLPAGLVATSMGADCDDNDSQLYQPLLGYPDMDLDTYGGDTALLVCSGASLPAGTATVGGDCDDNSASEWERRVGFVDGDGDGVGGAPVLLCVGAALPEGYAESGGDCDDSDSALGLNCQILCIDADGDGYGPGCEAGPDCDDDNGDVYQDLLAFADVDGDGFGEVGGALVVCSGAALADDFADVGGDCNDSDEDVYQDLVGYVDADLDGVGGDRALVICAGETLPMGFVSESGDCSDADGDNIVGCATCVDADGDGLFFGCDQYELRDGPDCAAGDSLRFETRAAYRDRDRDTYTVGGAVTLCVGAALPMGWVETASSTEDCNDFDADRYRQGDLYLDLDGDEVAAAAMDGICFGDEGPEGFLYTTTPGVDCDDLDADLYQLLTGFVDWDEDEYTIGEAVEVCSADELPDGYLASASASDDCDDRDPSTNPSASDFPGDFHDQDCAGGDPLPTDSDGVFVDNAAACGTGTIASPFCDLYDGIDAAVLNSVAVYVTAETYDVNIRGLEVSIYGDWNNTFTARDESEGNDTVFRADDERFPVVNTGDDAPVTLANLKLEGRYDGFEDETYVLENDGVLVLREVEVSSEPKREVVFLVYNNDELLAFDSVFRNAESCEENAYGLYNEGEARLVRVTIEEVFAGDGNRPRDHAYGIRSRGPLTVIDSVIRMGTALRVTGISTEDTLTLVETDVHILGGDQDCTELEEIQRAWAVEAIMGVDAIGGEYVLSFPTEWVIGFVVDGENVRLTEVDINIGADILSGTGVNTYSLGGTTRVSDSVIEVNSVGLGQGLVVAYNLILSGTTVTVAAGTNIRGAIDILGEESRSILYDNVMEVGDSTELLSRAIFFDGPLLAVRNQIDVGGSSSLGSSGIAQRPGGTSLSVYDSDISIRGTLESVRGISFDERGSDLVAEQNTISVMSSEDGGATGIYFRGRDASMIDNEITVGDAATGLTGISLSEGEEAIVLGNTIQFEDPSTYTQSIGMDNVTRGVIADNIVATGNSTDIGAWGIRVTQSDEASVLVTGNDIIADAGVSGSDITGIDITGFNAVVELNHIAVGDTAATDDLDNTAIGVRLGPNSAGGFATLRNNVIEVGAGDESFGVWLSSGAADIFHNTIAAGPALGGESIGVLLEGDGSTQLANNIIMPGPGATSIGLVSASDADLLVMNNLIFSEDMTLLGSAGARSIVNIESLDLCAWWGCTLAGGNLGVDPQLVDFPGLDHHLSETSPAIDAGVVPLVPIYLDLDREGRPIGGADDIGADEFRE